MFVAHIFAGYLGSRYYVNKADPEPGARQSLVYLFTGMFFSIFPDIDLLYFYFITQHQPHSHHAYWIHMPWFWVVTLLLATIISRGLKKNWQPYIVLSGFGIASHLVLDSVAGGIYWLYPFSDIYWRMFSITPKYHWWVLNYLLHWTFLLEILIISFALYYMKADGFFRKTFRLGYISLLLMKRSYNRTFIKDVT